MGGESGEGRGESGERSGALAAAYLVVVLGNGVDVLTRSLNGGGRGVVVLEGARESRM
jgi:hypothetical protein